MDTNKALDFEYRMLRDAKLSLRAHTMNYFFAKRLSEILEQRSKQDARFFASFNLRFETEEEFEKRMLSMLKHSSLKFRSNVELSVKSKKSTFKKRKSIFSLFGDRETVAQVIFEQASESERSNNS